MPEAVTLRTCVPDDLPEIHRITVAAFPPVSIDHHLEEQYGPLRGTTWDQRKCAAVSADLQGNPEGCFVALLEGRIVGYVTTAVDEATGSGRILNLAVDPEVHGQGLGKRLLCQAFEYFRGRELPYYRIETTCDNPVGQVLYPRCGFREISRQIIYFMSAEEAADWTFPPAEQRQEQP